MAKTNNPDVEFIKALAELLKDNDLTELEVSRESGDDNELKVRLSRQVSQPIYAPAPQYAPAPSAPAAAPAMSAAPAAASAAAPEDPAQHPGAVPSPMVGTVYLAAEPGAANFIKTGDVVKEGQTLLIVEAMKTMNQIPSPRAGTVKRIVVEDGQPVEFGAPLVILE